MLECAAGTMCCAALNAILANSIDTCWGFSKKIHSALLCGSSFFDMIHTNPSVVGIKLTNGHIIEQDIDNKNTLCLFHMHVSPLNFFRAPMLANPWPKKTPTQCDDNGSHLSLCSSGVGKHMRQELEEQMMQELKELCEKQTQKVEQLCSLYLRNIQN
jgi:hypothetical protein